MPLEQLRDTVDRLERELQSLGEVDEDTRRLLEEAVGEIQTALTEKQAETLRSESLSEKLSVAAHDFETTHPTLGGLLSRTIDLLGQIGI